jgi:hypothetical protein
MLKIKKQERRDSALNGEVRSSRPCFRGLAKAIPPSSTTQPYLSSFSASNRGGFQSSVVRDIIENMGKLNKDILSTKTKKCKSIKSRRDGNPSIPLKVEKNLKLPLQQLKRRDKSGREKHRRNTLSSQPHSCHSTQRRSSTHSELKPTKVLKRGRTHYGNSVEEKNSDRSKQCKSSSIGPDRSVVTNKKSKNGRRNTSRGKKTSQMRHTDAQSRHLNTSIKPYQPKAPSMMGKEDIISLKLSIKSRCHIPKISTLSKVFQQVGQKKMRKVMSTCLPKDPEKGRDRYKSKSKKTEYLMKPALMSTAGQLSNQPPECMQSQSTFSRSHLMSVAPLQQSQAAWTTDGTYGERPSRKQKHNPVTPQQGDKKTSSNSFTGLVCNEERLIGSTEPSDPASKGGVYTVNKADPTMTFRADLLSDAQSPEACSSFRGENIEDELNDQDAFGSELLI